MSRREQAGDDDGPIVRNLSTFKIEPVHWLWLYWLARRKVAILAGVEGDGKSMIMSAIVAALSCGGKLPNSELATACRVLVLLAEDGVSDVFKPRLARHGANMLNVEVLEAVRESGKQRMFSLARHLDMLRDAIATHTIDVVVIDPLSSFMQHADRNSEGDIRDVLTPLSQLAEQTNVAILGIAHLNRPNGTNRRAVQRILGSGGIGAVARLVWMTSPIGDHDDPRRSVLAVVKSNLAFRPAAIEWTITAIDEPISWLGTSERSIDDLLNAAPKPTTTPERQEILDLLKKNPQGLKPEDVALMLDKNTSTTRNLLRRLLATGDVFQPAYGLYAAHSA